MSTVVPIRFVVASAVHNHPNETEKRRRWEAGGHKSINPLLMSTGFYPEWLNKAVKTGFVQAACSHQQACVWWRWTTKPHCTSKTSIPSLHVLDGRGDAWGKRSDGFSPHSLPRCLQSSPSVLYWAPLCFLVVYRRILFNPPRAPEHPSPGSAPPHPSARPAPPELQAPQIRQTRVQLCPIVWIRAEHHDSIRPRCLSPLARPLRILSSTAARRRASPHLTAVASGALSEQDDGELIWLAAHSQVGGAIRATRRQEETRTAEVYAGLFTPHLEDR